MELEVLLGKKKVEVQKSEEKEREKNPKKANVF
jgi:hypothetical protein